MTTSLENSIEAEVKNNADLRMSIFTLGSRHHLQKFYHMINLNGNPNQVTNICYYYELVCPLHFISYKVSLHTLKWFFITMALGNKLENQGLKRLYMTFSTSKSN